MISVFEVVVDPDMIAPQPFTVLRSTGMFVLGGFQSVTTAIPMFGPVQQASNKEVQMLQEADRIGSIRSFWSTQPIYTTRGYSPVPGIHGEVPTGTGLVFYLSVTPPSGIDVYASGLLLQPSVDYVLSGNVLTFTVSQSNLYVVWQEMVSVQADASDLIQYESETFRVLSVYLDPGSGYWKALGTRTAAA